jgi:hypothetical protein
LGELFLLVEVMDQPEHKYQGQEVQDQLANK